MTVDASGFRIPDPRKLNHFHMLAWFPANICRASVDLTDLKLRGVVCRRWAGLEAMIEVAIGSG